MMPGPDEAYQARLHVCHPASRPVTPGTRVERLPYLTIDVHCHLLEPAVEALVAEHPTRIAQAAKEAEALGAASVQYNQSMFHAVRPKLVDVGERLNDMDAMGVDIQAISVSPTQYHYWAEPDVSEKLVDLANGSIAATCAAHPDRFVGLGTVSLQHPDMAARQLRTLMRDHGFKGVQISTLVNDMDIADRFFDPFWDMADALEATVFIHPWGTTLGARLADYYLANTVGQPMETTICLSKLIFGGTLDRRRKLKIIAAHGGGYLPYYIGRSDHAHAVRPEAGGCGCAPSDLLRRIWYDTILYQPEGLARLIEQVGARQVVLGTDYPFDMGHYDPMSLVRAFDEETQRMILGGNAASVLGLVVERGSATIR